MTHTTEVELLLCLKVESDKGTLTDAGIEDLVKKVVNACNVYEPVDGTYPADKASPATRMYVDHHEVHLIMRRSGI